MATIRVPEVVPSPPEDCEKLTKAFKGLGTDEKAIIRVLGAKKYKPEEENQRDSRFTTSPLFFVSILNYLRTVILWAYDPPERDARLANKALKSWKKNITELQVLVEIACASSPHHLAAVRHPYCVLFERSLEEDIISNEFLPVQKVLFNLVSSYRYDKEVVDSSIANMEAVILHDAIRAKNLEDDDLVWILSTRNIFQLRATFPSWLCGKFSSQDIRACGKGILESILKVVVWCIDSPERHFMEVVRASIVGLGTMRIH
ncbi:annexin D3-like isoform X2 [Olea europaea subsp. europaea]|uniref:Annexin D3-like isoform X2 n=1 Tax=Olea europaea subsp. europaea TaxID=158383 RepID=A0A8S0U014_OLEEU|nr:annexin D3-like isoform X2 [Olea europaea subsp. europaea]